MNKAKIQDNPDTFSKWETPRLINTPTEKDCSTDCQEGAKAYKEGHKKGYQAGMEQANQDMKQRFNIVDTYITALSQPFIEQNHQIAECLANLAGKIAQRLVRRELRTEPETIMLIVRETVTALNSSTQKINIHLHPENAQIVREIINVDSQEKSWKIIDDPLLARTDCKVNSQDALIDADLHTRINLIITQFLGDERSESRE